MPEGIIGVVWAFCLGLAAASGAIVTAILGLRTHLRHRAIAAFMSVGAGVLLSRLPRSRSHPRRSCWPARHPL